ncbi:protein FAM210B, mitochondrial isoform X2 [Callithrix jacchus]|uniref:protein FAM210B, mitochondrial isoform X2 n=1 Tax=Callithrix jacchus TaxID=9483 RepID=UPI00159DDEC4|nr:protein FAM210B, mitochondrial isoform X2 [Callithrix jacchus]
MRSMAGLLALLGPAGRVGARVRPRATWLLGAAVPCAPPPLALALLPPRPDAGLLRTARGDYRGRQDLSPPTETAGSSISCTSEKKLSKSQQLKKIFQEYGTVGVSLHIGISLISLGIFYMVVSRVSLCCPGWSAVAPSRLTEAPTSLGSSDPPTSASQVAETTVVWTCLQSC